MASARRKPNKFFFMFLLMLYPVLPLNYYIGSLSYANICGIMMVLAFFFFRLKKFDVRVFHEDWPFWQYLVVYALFTFATANALNGLAWVIADLFASVSIITSIETKEDFYQAIDGVILAGVLLGLLGIAESATGTYLIQGELMAKTDGGVGLRYGILRRGYIFFWLLLRFKDYSSCVTFLCIVHQLELTAEKGQPKASSNSRIGFEARRRAFR